MNIIDAFYEDGKVIYLEEGQTEYKEHGASYTDIADMIGAEIEDNTITVGDEDHGEILIDGQTDWDPEENDLIEFINLTYEN